MVACWIAIRPAEQVTDAGFAYRVGRLLEHVREGRDRRKKPMCCRFVAPRSAVTTGRSYLKFSSARSVLVEGKLASFVTNPAAAPGPIRGAANCFPAPSLGCALRSRVESGRARVVGKWAAYVAETGDGPQETSNVLSTGREKRDCLLSLTFASSTRKKTSSEAIFFGFTCEQPYGEAD